MPAIPHEVCQVVAGLAVTIVLGAFIKPLMGRLNKVIKIQPPNEEAETVRLWDQLVKLTTGGAYVGFFERFIFFASIWSGAWPMFASWLAFKLALYWQGAKFASFPDTAPSNKDLAWLVSRRQLGTHHVATVLVGTAASVSAAFAGVVVGKMV
jgi:hypothetical protein